MTDGDSGVGSVAADASPFGGSSALPLSNGGIGDTYSASFRVDATSTTDGSYAITVMATDNDANVATADTNQLTLDTDTGGEAVVIEEFTVTAQSPKNPHVEIDMSWQVSGSPESVHLTLSETPRTRMSSTR